MEGETKVESPGPNLVMFQFCLILESRFRSLLRMEKLKSKRGKSRKLNKTDLAEIEEEVRLFKFDPSRFIEQQLLPRNLLDSDHEEIASEAEKSQQEAPLNASQEIAPEHNGC